MKRVMCLVLVLMMSLGIMTGCQSRDSDNVIKVGILGPHTGEYAQYGVAVKNGALLYIEKINEEGGINGKKIEPVVYDQKGKSTESITAFNRMLDEGVTALIG